MVRRGPIVALLGAIAFAARLRAGELSVEPQSVRMNDFVTITLRLDGSFAELDAVTLPLDNLALLGEPSVSSEFGWVNGVVSRHKTFRYRARPRAAGMARVGPVVLVANGKRETLASVAVEVSEERISSATEPAEILAELRAAGRPLIFLVAEVDRRQVWAGEQVVVTWSAYNAETVQQWQLVEAPKMPEFWVEEFGARPEEEERVWVGGQVMQKVTVRRTAIYPLRAGTFEIGRMTMEAAVLEPIRRGPFSIFEGNLEEVTLLSSPLTIEVKPLPPGPPVAATGDLTLECGTPFQRNGPVVVPVKLAGIGNLRSATTPGFDGRVRGALQIDGGEIDVAREPQAVRMSREWRYLIFPSQSGPLAIPPISLPIFSTRSGSRTTLRCNATTFDATVPRAAAAESKGRRTDAAVPAPSLRQSLPYVIGGLLAAGLLALLILKAGRERRLRRRVREIVEGATPALIRERVEALLPLDPPALLAEHSDRGDAWRALRSILDAAERDRDLGGDPDLEIARRLRELLTLIGDAKR